MPILRMKHIGLHEKHGRFANQLLQYAYLRIVSNGEYECGRWLGTDLFGHKDLPVTGREGDISGQFQRDSSFYAPHKELFRSLFKPLPQYQSPAVAQLREMYETVIGLHLRRGDYQTFTRPSAKWTFIAPTDWYLDWLKENFNRFPNPVLYIASDEREKVIGDFGDYPFTSVSSYPPETPFYADFYNLTQCDVLLISNSTFGFAASMLNERATEFWRPRLSQKKLIPYDPWNGPVVFKDEKY